MNLLTLAQERILRNNLSIFVVAYETHNYTQAARILKTSQPVVSNAISYLEGFYKVSLFGKHGRDMTPLEAADQLYKKAKQCKADFYDAHNFALEKHKYTGSIRLWMTDGLGSFCLSQYITEFCHKFPDVTLNITCSNNSPDISQRDADIAIVYHKPKQKTTNVISEHIVHFGLFASKSYVERHGLPKDLQDLQNNHFICDRQEYCNEWDTWEALLKESKHLVACSNSTNILIQLNRRGLGIALHPITTGQNEPELIRVLPDFELEHPYWLVSRKDEIETPKIKELSDFLKDVMNTL